MAWLDRGGRSYEYKSVREGDRVRSRYVPGSALPADVGDMLRQRDRRARESAAEDRETWAAERAVMAEADRRAVEIDREFRAVAELALVACGFRQSHRGRWHKRRVNNMATKTQTKPTTSALPAAAEVGSMLDAIDRAKAEGGDPGQAQRSAWDAAQTLRAAAQSGNAAAMPGLRVILDRRPDFFKPIDLIDTAMAEAAMTTTAKDDLLGRELAAREIREVCERVAGPDPTPLERLLAERVALTWFVSIRSDIAANRAVQSGSDHARFDFLSRQQSRADARFHAACKSFATVRRLALPILHVYHDVTPPQPVATTPQSDRLRIVAGEGG